MIILSAYLITVKFLLDRFLYYAYKFFFVNCEYIFFRIFDFTSLHGVFELILVIII